MRRCPPAAGGSKWNGRLPSSRSPEMMAGEDWYTHTSVMQVPLLTAPGLTLGAALSNRTRERPFASLPVTTRRIGLIGSGMGFLPGEGTVRILQRTGLAEERHERESAAAGMRGRVGGDSR